MTLTTYREKRNFRRTPEPAGQRGETTSQTLGFVVQKHAASRLHYDFRLELDGVLKSWAVPKGPSLDPAEKSLAVEVEDHPLDYASFEGIIPHGQYGGGTVMVWDQGTWTPEGDPLAGLKKGKLSFTLDGDKLHGEWTLVRMRTRKDDGTNWLLIKKDDKFAKPGDAYGFVEKHTKSVVSRRSLEQIAGSKDKVRNSKVSKAKRKPTSRKPAETTKTQPNELELSTIQGVKKGRLPKSFKPQLATLVTTAPSGDDWFHELKFDGYRLLAACEGDRVTLFTRRGEDWTHRFPTIRDALAKLQLHATLLDGEAVVLDAQGASDFQALQNVLRSGESKAVHYYAFDVPYADGYNLTGAALIDRKEILQQLLSTAPADGVLRYSDHIRGDGSGVIQHACQHSLEGIISKRASAPYEQRRSKSWVKYKCLKRQEMVIGGWTKPSGSRIGFGALLLGHYDDGELVYSGRVGTGFTRESLEEVHDKLQALATRKAPFTNPPKGTMARGVHWVEPTLVCEVEFTEWTNDGALRHPSFKGLREDKVATSVIREQPSSSPTDGAKKSSMKTKKHSGDSLVAGVRISSGDRVVYPDADITKLELAEYYAAIADWMLPYVADRPLTVVRCPQGRGKQCFYQKHAGEGLPDTIGRVEIQEDNGTAEYLTVDSAQGLVALVQFGTLEFHPWGCRTDRLDRPDWMVFDLDPGEGAEWKQVVAGAKELRTRLASLEFEMFLRTTGGKGLHVVVPLTRRQSWDDIKEFSHLIADRMAADSPDDYIATSSKAKRHGKVYVDYLRNAEGATSIASYSTRARAGAPVATPLAWEELTARLRPDQYNVRNVLDRLAKLKVDPWKDFFSTKQSLTKSVLKKLVESE
ncbi:DNA ligase D [Aeoliella sp. SH292]|uniref:DNA ligase D n=1 Tax=Aeoliella sp. SH292 TaxID=3454464 RepID=UPI003F958745